MNNQPLCLLGKEVCRICFSKTLNNQFLELEEITKDFFNAKFDECLESLFDCSNANLVLE